VTKFILSTICLSQKVTFLVVKSELFELVHLGVCGLLKVKSYSGVLYFITCIDDCFRKLSLCISTRRSSSWEVQGISCFHWEAIT